MALERDDSAIQLSCIHLWLCTSRSDYIIVLVLGACLADSAKFGCFVFEGILPFQQIYFSYPLIFFSATPADVSLLMQLGVDGVFVGSGIFKSTDPDKRAKAMVQAVTHYKDFKLLAEVSENLGEPMVSLFLT